MDKMNMFHGIDVGEKSPEEINVVIENAKGTSNKIEYDKDLAAFKLDRVLYSAVFWPFEYGFVPQTWHEDEDPVDVVVLSTYPTFAGCVMSVRPVGLIVMEDEKGLDDKVIVVPTDDPRFSQIKDFGDIPEHTRKEIQEFFQTYKNLEPKKWVKLKEWKNAEFAKEAIKKAVAVYKKKFGK